MANVYLRWSTLHFSAIDVVLDIFITSGGVYEWFTVIIYVPFLTIKEKSLNILLKKNRILKKAIFFIFYEGRVLILNLASTKNDSILDI